MRRNWKSDVGQTGSLVKSASQGDMTKSRKSFSMNYVYIQWDMPQ